MDAGVAMGNKGCIILIGSVSTGKYVLYRGYFWGYVINMH